MTVNGRLRVAGAPLLLAGFVFVVRWRVGSRGQDPSSRDRWTALGPVGASPVRTALAIVPGPGGG